MDIAVRYFSALGNTKAIAGEIAAGAGVKAISPVVIVSALVALGGVIAKRVRS